MADKVEGAERGEYVIGIAIILAALLVSATVYISVGGLQNALSNLKLTAASGGTQATAPTGGTQQSPPPTQPSGSGVQTVQRLSGLDYSSAYAQGPQSADLVMVEYSDFECPFCGRAAPTLAQVRSSYPNLRFVYRHFPLSFHPKAQKAAEASECAGKQGKFWELHDRIFADQSKLSVSDLKATAASLGLNAATFNTCVDSGETASAVSAQLSEGSQVGITGTPGFLVYSKTKKGAGIESKLQPIVAKLQGFGVDAKVVLVDGAGTGMVFAGALPYANFQEVLDAFGS